MELEKLKKIIADVLNVDPNEITEEETFVEDQNRWRGRGADQKRVGIISADP